MKQWIAYMFLVIFSLQVIPIKEIGKILFKGQITEEEVHGYSHSGGDDSTKLKKEGDPLIKYDPHAQANARNAFFTHQVLTAIHTAEHLPKNYVPDIITPPPNCG